MSPTQNIYFSHSQTCEMSFGYENTKPPDPQIHTTVGCMIINMGQMFEYVCLFECGARHNRLRKHLTHLDVNYDMRGSLYIWVCLSNIHKSQTSTWTPPLKLHMLQRSTLLSSDIRTCEGGEVEKDVVHTS